MSEPAPNLGGKIRSGTRWSFAGSFTTEIVQFGVGILLARLLMPEDFGLVATVGVLTGLAGYFSGAGSGQALVRAECVERKHLNVVFTLQLLLSCAIYLIFVVAAPLFASFFKEPIYQSLLLVSGLSFFLRPFANLPGAILHREMRFRPTVIINLIGLIGASCVSVSLALLGYGVWSLVLGGLFSALLRAIMLNYHVRHQYALAWDSSIVREMGGYGVKVASNSLIEHLRGQTLLLILSKFNGHADVGLYNRSSSLSSMPMRVVGSAPYQAVFRALAAEQDNLDKSRYIYFRTITLVLTYTLPFYVMIWWLAEPGIRFLYGEKWIASAEPLAILAGGGLFKCLGNPSGAVVEARNRVQTELKLNLIAWAILLVGAFYGLQWGLVGVAWAAVVMTAFFHISLTHIATQELEGSTSSALKAMAPPCAMNALLFLSLFLFDRLLIGSYASSHPALYCFSMGALSTLIYGVMFLLAPPKSLKAESEKWRVKLRSII